MNVHYYKDDFQKSNWLSHGAILLNTNSGELVSSNNWFRLCEELNLNNNKLSKVINGKAHSHKGYVLWKGEMPTNIITHSL